MVYALRQFFDNSQNVGDQCSGSPTLIFSDKRTTPMASDGLTTGKLSNEWEVKGVKGNTE
jgi:hypothetical protein